MNDPDKTQKILCIRRTLTREEIAARELLALRHFEKQIEIVRDRLRALEIAA